MTKPRAFVLPSIRIAVRALLDALAGARRHGGIGIPTTRHRLPPTLIVAAAIVLAAASGARAHTDPPGCSFTGVALLIQTFRADGVTPLIGSVVECETIQYRLLLLKPGGAETCAFEGGSLTLTTPDGVVHPIDGSVPCIGGTTADCTTTQVQSGLIAYGVRPADVVNGAVMAHAQYLGATIHSFPEDATGVGATVQKGAMVVFCNDGDPCTFDACSPATGQCVFTPDPCNDGDACTDDSCDQVFGCINTPVNCTDGDACTIDTCDPSTGGCVYTQKSCDDGNACTTDSCDPILGCDHAPVECDDFNPCTVDACAPSNGACTATPIPGCDWTYWLIGEHGGSASTDSEGDGATPSDPIETTLISPGPEVVTIAETDQITTAPPVGYVIFGQQVSISTTLVQSATNPLVLIFRLDASILPDPTGGGLHMLRDGVLIADCNGTSGTATPDPCHSATTILPDGDAEYIVLTTHASEWNFVVPSLVETGIAASKLEIVQNEVATGKAKVTWMSKDRAPGAIAKGAAGSPSDLSGTFEVFYADAPGNRGRFALPPAGWTVNSAQFAKYMNRLAPGGAAAQATTGQGVTSVTVRPDRQAKVSAKSRGEDAAKIDLLAGSVSPSGLVTVLTIENAADGFVHRMCTRFPSVVTTPLAGGTGRKLTAKNGVPVPCP